MFPSSDTSSATAAVASTSEKASSTSTGHDEQHAAHGEFIRDAIIGFADGLTVPFALTAGLSSLGSSKLVILAGLAELFSGAISMGLGAYLAAVTEKKHYDVEEERERREVTEKPQAEEDEIYEIFEQYGISRAECAGVVNGLKANQEQWVRFMMDFELKLEKPHTRMAWIEGLVMGVAYFIGKQIFPPASSDATLTFPGGLLPMIPYFAFKNVNHALFTSIGITALILVVFGYTKAVVTGCKSKDAAWSAAQTLFVGVLVSLPTTIVYLGSC